MVKLIKEANDLLTLWRSFGPGDQAIDLKAVFQELILPKANGDVCVMVEDHFDSFEGLMAYDETNKRWCIGVDSRISPKPRKNFTLAHEIGHFIGHRHLGRTFQCTFDDMNDFQSNQLEKEANEFAAHLLMPPDSMRKLTLGRVFDQETVEELSELFGVSKAAFAYRWVDLATRPIGFVISRDGMFVSGRASDRLYGSGTFFRSGDEVPVGANVHALSSPSKELKGRVAPGVWNEHRDCVESSYATSRGGYVYTYLDFVA